MNLVSNEHDLPVSFYFRVSFLELLQEVAFKEVSGLTAEVELETIREGGVNEYEYKLPKQIKYSNLSLKRALMPLNDVVEIWIKSCLEDNFSFPIYTVNVIISLLNSRGIPIRSWNCSDTYPVKFEIGNFDSERNEIMIESIELAYKKITRIM